MTRELSLGTGGREGAALDEPPSMLVEEEGGTTTMDLRRAPEGAADGPEGRGTKAAGSTGGLAALP